MQPKGVLLELRKHLNGINAVIRGLLMQKPDEYIQ